MEVVTTPSFSFEIEKQKYEFYALREGQAVRNHSKREESGGAYFHGPGIVSIVYTGVMVQYSEYHVDDAGVWAWLSFLANEGIPTGKVTSNTDQLLAQQQYQKKLEEERTRKEAEEKAKTLEDIEQEFRDRLSTLLFEVEEKFQEYPGTWKKTLLKMEEDIADNIRGI